MAASEKKIYILIKSHLKFNLKPLSRMSNAWGRCDYMYEYTMIRQCQREKKKKCYGKCKNIDIRTISLCTIILLVLLLLFLLYCYYTITLYVERERERISHIKLVMPVYYIMLLLLSSRMTLGRLDEYIRIREIIYGGWEYVLVRRIHIFLWRELSLRLRACHFSHNSRYYLLQYKSQCG